MTAKKFVEPPANAPAPWDLPDAAAIQALTFGTASPDQQRRALEWIVNSACGTYDSEYRSNDREHAYASGRRFVGLQIVKMTKLNLGKLKKE